MKIKVLGPCEAGILAYNFRGELLLLVVLFSKMVSLALIQTSLEGKLVTTKRYIKIFEIENVFIKRLLK